MGAVALTEHGNVSSHVKLEQAATKHGIKPLFGLEAYTAPVDMRETGNQRKWHLSLLAQNEQGYRNLMQVVTRSWDEDFYRWPTITGESLAAHSEGLIVLSGCADSKIACDLLGGKGRETGSERDAVRTLKAFKKTFGDRFYLEVQQFPELGRTRDINSKYEEWSRKYGIPLVATSDVHYPFPENNEMQKILHAAGRNTGTVAAAEAEWEYDILLTYPQSDLGIYKRLRATGLSKRAAEQAIASTVEIAERCTVELPKMARVRYPLEGYESSEKMVRQWLNDGWKYRGFTKLPRATQKEYKARAEYELGLMADKDFLDYFLMLSDAVKFCKDTGIPVGPARGSAAASLVCYLLRITEVNPMEYPLMLFERFIDPNRHDLPDVDLDFDDDLRDGVRRHMAAKYGADRVGNIGTFTRYRGKNAIDDVARVYKIPKFETEAAKEFLIERSGGDSRFDASIGDTIEMFPQVKEVFERHPDLYRSVELEGNLKGFGVHAAGIVVGAEPLWNYVATYSRTVGKHRNKLQVLSVDKYDGEHLGLLKLDALGLKTMGMIRVALELIDMSLEDLYKIPMDDPDTLTAFNRADVVGIFQFEGRTMKMVTQELKPETFMDLAAINALSRPGPLHSGSTGDYIAIRHKRMEHEPLHPIVEEICESTEGQIIYQEQILQICRLVGKFPWVHAATIRKVISQKKGEAAFNELWEDFKKGAAENGIDEILADRIWRKMVTAGTYAFNIAHCVSYSMLGFWTMWLKVHHPLAFYAAQLRKTTDAPKQLAFMRDMQDDRFGRSYRVLAPDPEASAENWVAVENGVRAGFLQVPGIGEKTAEAIVEQRKVALIEEWSDLSSVKGIGPKTIQKIQEFADDPDPFGIDKIRRDTFAIKKFCESEGLPIPDTVSDDVPYEAKRSDHVILGLLKARNLQDLFENHRSRTGEELDPGTVKEPELKDSMTLYLEDVAGLITLKVDRWKYPGLKAKLWDAKLGHDYILAKVVKRAFYGKTIHTVKLWVVDPD